MIYHTQKEIRVFGIKDRYNILLEHAHTFEEYKKLYNSMVRQILEVYGL